jgi:hypothetical protein
VAVQAGCTQKLAMAPVPLGGVGVHAAMADDDPRPTRPQVATTRTASDRARGAACRNMGPTDT